MGSLRFSRDTTSEMRSSASWHMVRNLRMRKGCPRRPARSCLKSAGPRESSFTASAMRSIRGLRTTSTSAERTTSIARLTTIDDHDVPQVPYSITGSSAMWLSRTAVPSIARIGGITLSFTPSERQTETTRASVDSSSSGIASTTRSAPDSATRAFRSCLLRSSKRGACDPPPSPFRAAVGRSADLEHGQMVSRLQGELAGHRVGQGSAAQHERLLGRNHPAPDRSRRGAQQKGGGQGG